VFLWTYTLPSERSIEIVNEAGYPLFKNADSCARVMAAMADYRRLRERRARPQAAATWRQDHSAARAVLDAAPPILPEWQARPMLAAYGIAGGEGGTLARSAAEAEKVARKFDRPVALKVQSPDIMHKTEAGCVALNVSAAAAASVYEKLIANAERNAPKARIDGVLVQPMAAAGREVILGVSRDPTWGPLLMVGLGGVLVEALGDVALSPVPLDHEAARDLLSRLKGTKLLGAYRGAAPADTEALVELMVRLSHFAADHGDDVAEIDLNPVIVHDDGNGLTIADALIVRSQQHNAARAAE
jgi:acyl-CoA synthetase (NDP forming)